MEKSRLSLLLDYVQEAPQDPFNWYAIALEYQKIDPQQANFYFEHLLTHFGDYLPTYYVYALHLINLGEDLKAESVFEKGIKLSKLQENWKTLRELQSAFEEWKFS
ncbi:MAG TPA: enzyme of heme biosynthesis [Microscillaceae bacterium]|jgi:tetratricopeptide (TPR) repeat protein|nr:enzyme of heme biosynthesis [Microscillaceae bacterium]